MSGRSLFAKRGELSFTFDPSIFFRKKASYSDAAFLTFEISIFSLISCARLGFLTYCELLSLFSRRAPQRPPALLGESLDLSTSAFLAVSGPLGCPGVVEPSDCPPVLSQSG